MVFTATAMVLLIQYCLYSGLVVMLLVITLSPILVPTNLNTHTFMSFITFITCLHWAAPGISKTMKVSTMHLVNEMNFVVLYSCTVT